MRDLKHLLLASLIATISFPAEAVLIGSRDWRQLSETTGFSYNDLANGPCNASTGACSGTLGGINFTGWTWATIEDIGAMFESIGIGPAGTFSGPASYVEVGSSWAPAAIDIDGLGPDTGLFDPTRIDGLGDPYVEGITRSLVSEDPNFERTAVISQALNGIDPDVAHTEHSIGIADPISNYGVWLFQDTDTVPTPMTPALILAGLFAAAMRKAKAPPITSK